MTKRKIIAFVIVFAGIAFFLINVSSPTPKNSGLLLGVQGRSDINSNLNFKSAESPSTNALGSLTAAVNGDNSNLTDALAQAYLQNVFSVNTDVVSNGSSSQIALPTLNLDQEMSQGLKFKQLGIKDIRISPDNSKENQIKYLLSLSTINEKNFKGFNLDISSVLENLLTKKDGQPLQKYLGIASRQINDLLLLPVPSAWQDFHLQNLNLWQKKIIVYGALLDQVTDPLKTVVAIQEIPDVIQESLNLQTTLEEQVKKLNS
jgi:hypothetical protein